jgi:drug/metabolite transporter (DMT)-like permease
MSTAGFFFALGAAITWGLVYSLDQKILSESSPIVLLFIDAIITAILLLPVVLFTGTFKEALKTTPSNLLLMLVTTLLGLFASYLIFSGIKALGASNASIIEIAYPFFVVLFSYVLFKSTPNFYFFLGGALIFVGSVIVIKLA